MSPCRIAFTTKGLTLTSNSGLIIFLANASFARIFLPRYLSVVRYIDDCLACYFSVFKVRLYSSINGSRNVRHAPPCRLQFRCSYFALLFFAEAFSISRSSLWFKPGWLIENVNMALYSRQNNVIVDCVFFCARFYYIFCLSCWTSNVSTTYPQHNTYVLWGFQSFMSLVVRVWCGMMSLPRHYE